MSLENWALLASQNPRLAKEAPGCTPQGARRRGACCSPRPSPSSPGKGGRRVEMEGAEGGRARWTGGCGRRRCSGGAWGGERGVLGPATKTTVGLYDSDGYTIQTALAKVNRVEEASLAVFARNAIYIGGFKSDGSTLYFLHGHDLRGLRSQPDLPCVHALEAPFSTPLLLSGMLLFLHGHSLLLASEVVPRVYKGGLELEAEQVLLEAHARGYMGGLEAAAEQVLLGNMPPSDFRFFVGQVEWPAGKLQEEVDAGLWYTAACARSLVLKQCLQLPKPLW
ncbi:unnamed protein product [Closterium sp. NIES-64]|nr:unnamed protein product [Closterium sp. NIES-64]